MSPSDRDGERTPRRYLTNGQLREQIAHKAGGDPTRYGAGSQRRLTKEDVVRVAERLRPAEDALQFNQCDLATLYERACEWAGGEYQPNAGKAWGINRDNLKRIHQALDATEPRKVVMTDGGRDQGKLANCGHCGKLLNYPEYAKEHLIVSHDVEPDQAEDVVADHNWPERVER